MWTKIEKPVEALPHFMDIKFKDKNLQFYTAKEGIVATHYRGDEQLFYLLTWENILNPLVEILVPETEQSEKEKRKKIRTLNKAIMELPTKQFDYVISVLEEKVDELEQGEI